MKVRPGRMFLPLFFIGACSFPEYTFVSTAPITSTCGNGVQDPNETDVDCGGVCPVCSAGQHCDVAPDCDSAHCEDNVCKTATCSDRIVNGAESDVDCGGRCPKLCDAGARCNSDSDCGSANCAAGVCLAASCSDRISNGDETGVDCGGSCPTCANGSPCKKATDCSSQNCDATELVCVDAGCQDQTQNADETDVDCGGPTCAPCAATQHCLVDTDCDSDICDAASKRCDAASCSDTVINQGETDVDCGGSNCPACAVDKKCRAASDCASGICQGQLCVPAMASGVLLSQIAWQVSASNTFDTSTTNLAIDGDPTTRWTSGTPQVTGMWFEIDLSQVDIFFDVLIDSSQFPGDAGVSYDIYFSNDGNFGAPARSSIPGGAVTTIKFDSAQVARYIKIELASAGTNWWSIGEVSVYQ
ncbi:MAG TPA: discoidin domain-containing protein [Polyangiaceae bacterium]|nr:discoidin domain-containing protein [Polyangiaceae bacterium]